MVMIHARSILQLAAIVWIQLVMAPCEFVLSQTPPTKSAKTKLAIVSHKNNDIANLLNDQAIHYPTISEALKNVPNSASLLILASDYPERPTPITGEQWKEIYAKELRVFVEYPQSVPGLKIEKPLGVRWERAVIIGPTTTSKNEKILGLNPLSILSMQDCKFLPVSQEIVNADAHDRRTLLTVGRVAGFNQAIFGPPAVSHPILIQLDKNTWIATTKLSHFIHARFAPHDTWETLWENLLNEIDPLNAPYQLSSEPRVAPYYTQSESLPDNADRLAVQRGAEWYKRSRLLLDSERAKLIHSALLDGQEVIEVPGCERLSNDQSSDRSNQRDAGSFGILEGYASQILPDGSQLQRTPIRADCQAESAAALAIHAKLYEDHESKQIATNLLNFLYVKSSLHQGQRAEKSHASYGLIAWGAISPAWEIANYGDDNARTLLATMISGALLDSEQWDEPLLRALYANLLTTGKLGFRGDRVDMPTLDSLNRGAIQEREIVNLSPFFESYLWACYLWAFHHTQDDRFYNTAIKGIETTMRAYPDGWRWGDNLDRTHMLLALAWLVRVDDKPLHREWLRQVADDLIINQDACGAIPERLGNPNSGHYQAPTSNEAYGTMETPLIQENGDPVSDQLYVSGFALLALREVNAAIHEPRYIDAENRLANFLIRIQVKSPSIDYLDGTWFRAFDFDRWDYWSSSGDMGWGAWCAETGWGPAWNIIMLGLRHKKTSVWDVTQQTSIKKVLPKVQADFELD